MSTCRGQLIFPVAAALRVREVPFVFTTSYDGSGLPDEFRYVRRWEQPFNADALARAVVDAVNRA